MPFRLSPLTALSGGAAGRATARGMSGRVAVNLFTLVSAEVIAFALLEQSLRSPRHEGTLTAAAVAIMLVVPLCFKAMLKSGESIAVANLYWIALSLVLGALLSGVVFKESITLVQVLGFVVVLGGAVLAYAGGKKDDE